MAMILWSFFLLILFLVVLKEFIICIHQIRKVYKWNKEKEEILLLLDKISNEFKNHNDVYHTTNYIKDIVEGKMIEDMGRFKEKIGGFKML